MKKEQLLDNSITLGHLGFAGTFTRTAAKQYAGRLHKIGLSDIKLIGAKSIQDVLGMIETDEVTHGVVPIETTVADVAGAIKTLTSGKFAIVGEEVVKVEFATWKLGDIPDRDITRVDSKPEVYPQCSIYLDDPIRRRWKRTTNLPQNDSTAAALEYLIKIGNPTVAAIASPGAALDLLDEGRITKEEYRKLVCTPNIGNSNTQFTRFATIISTSKIDHLVNQVQTKPTGNDATTLIVDINDVSGALDQSLASLVDINITKIKSLDRTNDRVPFFMTIDGHLTDPSILSSLLRLQRHSRVGVLGSYPRAKMPAIEFDGNPNIEEVIDDIQSVLVRDGFRNHTQTALALTLKDKKGALRAVTRHFSEMGVNLTWIESFQSRRALGEYVFCLIFDNTGLKNRGELMRRIGDSSTQLVEITA